MIKKLCLVSVLALGTSLQALPLLQLDATGGDVDYDMATESVIVTGTSSTVIALVNTDNKLAHLDEYWLAVSVIGSDLGPGGADLGSFMLNGTTINVTGDMAYGVPPDVDGYESLQTHGVYPSWYTIIPLPGVGQDWVSGADAYNVQDNPGEWSGDTDGPLDYLLVDIDASNLDATGLHVDLFGYDYEWVAGNKKKNTEYYKIVKAPFSHDLIVKVPDGGTTLALLGLGLLGLGVASRRFKA